MPDLAILIVSWNVRDLLRACLESVFADLAASDLGAEVWVVDNASQDGSPEMVRTAFPKVRLLVSSTNLGFAGGNNIALRQMSTAEHVPHRTLLLNPDTQVRPGALRTLHGFMISHPRVGGVGAKLVHGDGSFQHGAFGFPGLWQIVFDLFPLPSRLYGSRLNGRYPQSWYDRGEPFPVDHPLGAAMMLRWEAIDQVGLFDEGFYMYCEEIDWCMRAKRAGWDIYCVPRAEVVHLSGRSTRQLQEASFVNLWRSRRRLYEKHYGTIENWLAKQLVHAGMQGKEWLTQRKHRKGELDEVESASRMRAYREAMACFD